MENFTVKTIDFVDYVKAVDVAKYHGKEKYHTAIRFIHKTFKDADILKFNATLYVKKLALERYLDSSARIEVLEKQVSDLERKNAECLKNAKEFKDTIFRNYQRNVRVLHEIDERSFQEILCYIHGEIPLTQFVEQKMAQIEKIFSDKS